MFIDTAKILIKSGSGGNGCVSFHREKYVAAGGPDGGDGGRGGSVVFAADKSIATLMDFRYKKKYAAQNGENGKDSRRSGKNAPDLRILVPQGTVVRDVETQMILADLSEDGKEVVIAKGGSGGWGNSHFATATRQAPKFAKGGMPGIEREVMLELKLIADVGLLGFPNVGKSTFLSIVSDARPKIANYHFTTLVPNLGVVDMGDGSFVVADIPGIIEGAHEGVGLGYQFLKHIERTRLLLHIVDLSGLEARNPIEDFHTINNELKLYSPKLSEKPQIVVANKMDIPEFEENFAAFKTELEVMGYKVFAMSAVTKQGLNEILNYVRQALSELPPPEIISDDEIIDLNEIARTDDEFTITLEDGIFFVEGGKPQKLLNSTNLDDYESLQYFGRALRKSGIMDELKKMGIKEGDTVSVCGAEFDYEE